MAAGFKIKKVGDKFAVVNGIGITKKTFADKDKAEAYLKTLTGPGGKNLPPWLKPAKADDEGPDDDDSDPRSLIASLDACLDAAGQLADANAGDLADAPSWVQQLCSLVTAASDNVDELMEMFGIPDAPDDEVLGPTAMKAQLQIAGYWQQARAFTADERDSLAKSGAALPDGSFPIETVGDLDNAIQAFGQAGNKAAAKAHIVKRANALGASAKLPDGWKT